MPWRSQCILRPPAVFLLGGSFLAREQFVKASGSQSRRFSVRSGVLQGSHLFINDVFSCFKSLRILLYADHLKIFVPVSGNSDFANAQAELDVFFPVVHRQRDAAELGEV
jgi:hypothetical protein